MKKTRPPPSVNDEMLHHQMMPQQQAMAQQFRRQELMRQSHGQQPMMNGGMVGSKAEMHVQALSQKNHRLAKELSDLRVRHREETVVVSRLTMENMNLATRCREAIAQVAALKKELAMYQKQQSNLTGEYDGLKREVMVLKKQISGSLNAKINGSGGVPPIANGASLGNGESHDNLLQQRTTSPTTDLDRIMSLQKFGGNKNKLDLPAEETVQEDNKFTDGAQVVSTNSKIPITIAPNNSLGGSSNQKDDEFDADIDMVDFFHKQSSTVTPSEGARLQNTKSLHHHVRKQKSNTDDVMPEDMVGTGSGLGFSPEGKKHVAGDSLLSSLDAFEASFASAFPETSFSISSDTPKETKMDMTFDVPDFGDDPFFNNFKTSSTPHAMVFDSTPVSFDDMSAASSNSKGKKKNRSALAPLSPQSMSAEIEQLDAILNPIGGEKGGNMSDASNGRTTRKVRNVKQPVSYAEPSTKSKLRRGDVIFPKVDAQTKYQQNNHVEKTTLSKGNTTAKVLKDLEQVSTMVAGIDIGKDP